MKGIKIFFDLFFTWGMFSSRFTEVIVISKNLYKVSGDVVVQGIASREGLCYSLTSMKQIKFDVYSRKYFFIFVPNMAAIVNTNKL